MVNIWTHLLLHALPVFAAQRGGLKDKRTVHRRQSDTPGVDHYRARAYHSGETQNGPHLEIIAAPKPASANTPE